MAQMDKAERRQVLLRAARDVFATKGYHDAKVDDIVAVAKVAKGTFYLYFTDKRAVLSELVDVLFQRLGAAILKVEPSADIEGQIKHNIRAIVAVLLDDPALTRILFSFAAGLDPAFVETIRAFYDGVKMLLEASLAEGQSLGIVAEGDAKVFATFTIGALKEMIFETVTATTPRPREEIVSALFHFLQAGYLRIAPAAEPAHTPRPPAVAAPPRSSSSRRKK
jgi:AcrR family transcriptional regulator